MANRLMVRGRNTTTPVIWEQWSVQLLMKVGHDYPTYQWMELTLTCRAGLFLQDFRSRNIPGFPEFDGSKSGIMRRRRTYRGRQYPSQD